MDSTQRRKERKGSQRINNIKRENQISEKIIGAALEVHRILGPGLRESVYEEALCHKLHLMGLRCVKQQSVPTCRVEAKRRRIPYKGVKLGTDLRLDLLIEDKVMLI